MDQKLLEPPENKNRKVPLAEREASPPPKWPPEIKKNCGK